MVDFKNVKGNAAGINFKINEKIRMRLDYQILRILMMMRMFSHTHLVYTIKWFHRFNDLQNKIGSINSMTIFIHDLHHSVEELELIN